jgi:hypothetical protein
MFHQKYENEILGPFSIHPSALSTSPLEALDRFSSRRYWRGRHRFSRNRSEATERMLKFNILRVLRSLSKVLDPLKGEILLLYIEMLP